MKLLVLIARRRHRRQQAAIHNRKIGAVITAAYENPPGEALAAAVRDAIAAGAGQVRTARAAMIAASDFPDDRREAVYAVTCRAIRADR